MAAGLSSFSRPAEIWPAPANPRRTSDEQLRGERVLRITQLLKQRGGWYQRPARTGPTPLHFLWLPYPAGRDAPNVAGCSSLPSPSAQIFGCATIRHHFGGIEVTDVALPNRRGGWQRGHALHTLAAHQVELRAAFGSLSSVCAGPSYYGLRRRDVFGPPPDWPSCACTD